MIEIPPLEELREARRRLADQAGNDVERYAALLAQVSSTLPGTYVAKPLLPPPAASEHKAKAS